MGRRAYRLAYDGAPFHGFQRQPDVPTVEDAVFDALRALDLLAPDADRPHGYAAAGRTDAGVSALAQTVALDAPEWLTPLALNGELPRDVRAWAHADASAGFHATHDAATREYRYHLHAPGADPAVAASVAESLEGEHDVHNLTTDDEGTVRRIDGVIVDPRGEFLVVTVRAPGFCRQQVRRLVSVLEAVATGERPVGWVDEVLSDEVLTGPDGIPSAPARPLVLTDVTYSGLSFAVDDEAAANARAVFDARRVEYRARAFVAGAVAEAVSERDG